MIECDERERQRLVGLAYRILGSVAEAEDVVQDALLRWRNLDRSEIHNPAAFLTTMVTRLAVNVLTSARVRRETYDGPWMPEPYFVPDEPDPDSISVAFLVLLESLTPAERAALVLARVFDYSHEEIANVLSIEVAASRQLLHRARAKLAQRRPRFRTDPTTHARLVGAFIAACGSGDPQQMAAVLADDVVARTDHGGKASAARKPVEGVARVARFMLGLVHKGGDAGTQAELLPINGASAIMVVRGGIVISVITFETDGERLCEINMVRNPDKLRPLALARGLQV